MEGSVRWVKVFGRGCLLLAVGTLAAMIIFGLALGLAWQVPVAQTAGVKLAAALAAAGLGFAGGGFIAGRLARGPGWLAGAVFGFLFGLASFVYILADWRALPLALAAGACGALGGGLADRAAFLRFRKE